MEVQGTVPRVSFSLFYLTDEFRWMKQGARPDLPREPFVKPQKKMINLNPYLNLKPSNVHRGIVHQFLGLGVLCRIP